NCGNALTPLSAFGGLASGQKFIFPTPLFLFARLLSGFARFFFGGGAIIIYSRPCPTLPIRGRHKGTPLQIFVA
ncbi:hypothetical protein KKE19_04245, partial [Patescibacteria group bacterium]|nr:hypothetical protein [Patescibacteria group bacterium]MBU4461456.1 hypothetical protein [Patescibacteria group bacterium]MCG2700372.1 hypothetical protein [Candidatus Parcubacteria bacterium]